MAMTTTLVITRLATGCAHKKPVATTAGFTTPNGGVITSPTPLDIQGGILQGIGTVAAGVLSHGQTGPGLSPGILGISGSYTQAALGGSFAVEVGGLTAGTGDDRLDVASVANLAGSLQVTLVNGFIPSPGDEFTILRCGSPTGTCLPGDIDFAVYEGVLGNFTSHVPVLRSTGGATTATFARAAGDRYDLMAAHNGHEEGSYGHDSTGAERALFVAECLRSTSRAVLGLEAAPGDYRLHRFESDQSPPIGSRTVTTSSQSSCLS